MALPSASQVTWPEVIAAGIAMMFAVSAFRRREGIGHKLRIALQALTAFGLVAYVGATWVCPQYGVNPAAAVVAGIICGLVIINRAPKRSRNIPRPVRREVIAGFEKATGEKYDGSRHHIDHKVPFAKGGSHTLDNLEVLPRSKNLAKSNRSPWWDVLGR